MIFAAAMPLRRAVMLFDAIFFFDAYYARHAAFAAIRTTPCCFDMLRHVDYSFD